MKGVSIIFNLYQPDKKILANIFEAFENQKISLPVELIVVDKKTNDEEKVMIQEFSKKNKKINTVVIKVNSGLSFAGSMNAGLRKAKYEILVIIQQDCIPSLNNWLINLVEPLLKNEEIVASTSKVTYPEELWDSLSYFTKSIMLHERGTITPGLDEKACAYKRDALIKIGLFNETDFQTAGEDFDIYIKLKKIGKISYPSATVSHQHPTNLSSRLKKTRQWANGFGALVRKYQYRMPRWYSGILKAIPIIGILTFIISFPFSKGIRYFPAYFMLAPIIHGYYLLGFWYGFFKGKQILDVFAKKLIEDLG